MTVITILLVSNSQPFGTTNDCRYNGGVLNSKGRNGEVPL